MVVRIIIWAPFAIMMSGLAVFALTDIFDRSPDWHCGCSEIGPLQDEGAYL